MKRFTLAASLLLVGCLFSQTRVPTDQLRPQPNTGVYVSTGKGMVLATVDPATLILDTSGTTPVLRALPQTVTPVPAPSISEKHVSIKPAAGATSVTIPDASYNLTSLNVYINGILQSVTDDYTVAGTSVTLNRTATTGDIVQLTYRF
jgi:hypothetical protein